MLVFSVFDAKAEAFARPFFCATRGEAIRSFTDVSRDKSHPIGAHPEDYTLFFLGDFDDSKGVFKNEAVPVSLGLAIEFAGSGQQLSLVANNKDVSNA